MKHIYCYFILIFLFSCTSGNKEKKLQDLSQNPIELKASLLQCDSTIWSTRIVESIDDKIITLGYSSDKIFQVYQLDKNNLKSIGSFGKKGNGPKEFPVAADCYYDSHNKALSIFSRSANIIKCYKVDLSSIENLYHSEIWKTIDIKCAERDGYLWKKIVPLSDSLYIAAGGHFEGNNLLSMLDIKTNRIDKINIQYPDDKNDSPLLIKRSVYMEGALLRRSNSNQFLYCCSNWGNYAEIITMDNLNRPIRRQIITKDYPLYTTAPDGLNGKSLDNTLMGITASVTEQCIYLLPNFLTKKEFLDKAVKRDYPSGYCNILYQFNWDGDFIRSYKLDKPIRNFIVNSSNKYIIGSSIDLNNGEDVFAKFNIKR